MLLCTTSTLQLYVVAASSSESTSLLSFKSSTSPLEDFVPTAAIINDNHEQQQQSSSNYSSSAFSMPSKSTILSTLLQSRALQDQLLLDKEERVQLSTINQIFNQITLQLPDSTVSKSGLDLTITDLKCRNLNINDITLTHIIPQVANGQQGGSVPFTLQKLNVDINGINISCNFRWEYKWTIFNGRGSGNAQLNPISSTSIGFDFSSQDYLVYPPSSVQVSNCNMNIEIQDMDFDGDGIGMIGGIIALFEGLMRDTVERELGSTVCAELKGLGSEKNGALDKLLDMLGDKVEEYLMPLEEGNAADPLSYENGMDLPMITSSAADGGGEEEQRKPLYVNFQELQEYAGEWINSALDQVNSFLGPDENDPFGKLGINTFITDNLLNDEGQIEIDPSIFFESGGNLFDTHDVLSQTSLSIQSIHIEGLNSFTEMDILNFIGKHTVQNKLSLDYLYIIIEMEAEMKASSQSNAVIIAPNSKPIKEQFTVDFILRGIELDFSIFLGMNTQTLGNLELGSLLHSKNILPCFISALDEAQFTGLSLTVEDIVPPTLSGFLDPGLDEIMSTAADALFEMYENVLIKAMPVFFDKTVRDMANDFVKNAVDVYKCPKNDDIAHQDRYIDFRDMFKSASDAAILGGSGDEPYGNIIPWVMNIVQDQVFAANEEGLLAMNDMFIAPMTKAQSGIEGTIKFNGTLVDLNKERVELDIWKAFADHLRLTISDVSVTGLDTIRGPIKVLEPRPASAYLLENEVSLGVTNRPLDASFKFGIEVGGAATSPLATNNVMDLKFRMPSIDVIAVLFATIQESRFMTYPLKDVLNYSCWLAMIPVSSDKSSPKLDVGLAMHYLDMIFDILANTRCESCTNTWLEDLNSIVDFLDENKFISGLKSKALSIGRDLLKGEWVQGMVDKQIELASQRCPHDAAFGSDLSTQVYPGFRGTRELVDGILYAAFPLVQVIAVIIAQKHSDLEISPPVDVELDVPADANLINLQDLSSIAGWADMALDEARKYLSGTVEGSQDLGITAMLKSLILDENGLMTIPIEDQGFEAGGVKLELYDVTMVGMDSFTLFEVLEATDSSTFSNSIKLERLGCTLQMGLSVEDDSSEEARMLLESGIKANEMETITVSLILKDVELDVSLLMAMDQDLMGELKLGSILNTSHIFSCLLSTIHSIGLSQFMMSIQDIEEFSISGFISEETNKSIQSMTEAIFADYKQIVVDAIPSFTTNTIRPILHDILQVLVGKARDDGACPEPDPSLSGILDLRDLLLSEEKALELLGRGGEPYGDMFSILYSFLDNMMSKSDNIGLSKINDLVASLTERQSNEGGDLYYPGDLFKQDLSVALNGLNAAIELGVSDVRISNLNSLGSPIRVLQPVKGEPSVVDNVATIGAGPEALKAEFRLLIKGKGDEIEVHNDLVLGLSLKSVDMMLELLAQIEEVPFLNFPLQDVLNMNCWLATMVKPVVDNYGIRVGDEESGMMLRKLALAVAEARLDIECIECSSPLIIEMAAQVGSQEGIKDTTEVANKLFDYISNLLGGDFIQAELDKLLTEAEMKCPHSVSYDQNFNGLKYEEMQAPEKEGDPIGFLIAIISVIAFLAVFVGIIFIVTRFVTRRRHDRWMATLNRGQKLELEKMQSEEDKQQKDLNGRLTSLVMSKDVPLFVRLFMPIVILGNVALFLSGHLSLGGTVNISGSFAGQSFNVDGFFEFSMVKSTIEMWNAGAKSLAILIAIFSGVWPYTKQLITLILWFTPTKWVTSKRRGSILHWLDVLGKWSMVDVFVLLMTLASFRLSVESPDNLSFLPDSLYSINMLVVPLWGLYANMLAQFVAQISSHCVIHYHRKTINAATDAQQEEWNMQPSNLGNKKESLGMHKFALDYEASHKRAVVRKSVHWVYSAALLSLVVLVICGCVLPSFGIEVLGLIGLAVESGNEFEQAKSLYSVFGLASMIMEQGRYLNTAKDLVGLGTLSSLLVITVFLVPLAQAACNCVQWFVPMTKKQRSRNTVLNEILSAWQYMEVYVLSIIIAAWQLGGVSEYMVNVYCEGLKGTFTSMAYYGILREEDAQCFRVDASVESASWILVAASIILCLVNHFIVSANNQKIQDDEIPLERRLHSDRWVQSKHGDLTVGMTMSVSVDEEEDWVDLVEKEPSVRLIKPRFTDYYCFATFFEEASSGVGSSVDVETAVLPSTESDSSA